MAKWKWEERFPDVHASGILAGGISWTEFFTFLHQAAMLRYFTPDDLHRLNSRIGTEGRTEKIQKLIDEMAYFDRTEYGYLIPGKRLYDDLGNIGKNLTLVQRKLRGTHAVHELKVSAVISKIIEDDPEFHYAFYPSFGDLRPDVAIVFLKKERQARLAFLEVEEKKPNWDEYIVGKMRRYEALAGDPETHSVFWQDKCQRLKFEMCSMDEFCFEVRVECLPT